VLWLVPAACREHSSVTTAGGLVVLDPSGKPTPRLRARVLREELEDRLQRLQELEQWIKQSAGDDVHERGRADKVAVAIDLLRLATDALELAGGE
jgi:hypothetical protein